jgi:hypothetical protein
MLMAMRDMPHLLNAWIALVVSSGVALGVTLVRKPSPTLNLASS